MNNHTVTDEYCIATLLDLLNVEGLPGRERKIREFIVGKLKQIGIADKAISDDGAHRRIPGGGEIGNLIVRIGGNTAHAPRLLSTLMESGRRRSCAERSALPEFKLLFTDAQRMRASGLRPESAPLQ